MVTDQASGRGAGAESAQPNRVRRRLVAGNQQMFRSRSAPRRSDRPRVRIRFRVCRRRLLTVPLHQGLHVGVHLAGFWLAAERHESPAWCRCGVGSRPDHRTTPSSSQITSDGTSAKPHQVGRWPGRSISSRNLVAISSMCGRKAASRRIENSLVRSADPSVIGRIEREEKAGLRATDSDGRGVAGVPAGQELAHIGVSGDEPHREERRWMRLLHPEDGCSRGSAPTRVLG